MDERTKELLLLGREHYQKGEYDRAERALLEVLKASDDYADVHHMVGVMLHARGDLAGAERHFERAVELNPRYTEALLNLSVTYNDLGKYEASRQISARMREAHAQAGTLDSFARGKIANLHAAVAQAYLDAGAPGEAIVELTKAVTLSPGFPDLWARLGSIHRDMGALEKAREAYEKALGVAPRYAHARVLLGLTLLTAGDHGGAAAAFREVLSQEPDNKHAAMYLRMVEAQRAKASAGDGAASPARSSAPPPAGEMAAAPARSSAPPPAASSGSVMVPPPPSAKPAPILDSIDLEPSSRGAR